MTSIEEQFRASFQKEKIDSVFVKWEATPIVGHILGAPVSNYTVFVDGRPQTYDADKHDERDRKLSYKWNFVELGKDQVRIITIPQKAAEKLVALSMRHAFKDWAFAFAKKGGPKAVEYEVLPADKVPAPTGVRLLDLT